MDKAARTRAAEMKAGSLILQRGYKRQKVTYENVNQDPVQHVTRLQGDCVGSISNFVKILYKIDFT